jgi:hypothetical protein
VVTKPDRQLDQIERQAQAYWDFMTEDERNQWAWLAGIIDGEGHIGIYSYSNPKRFRVALAVCMTHKPTIERIREITGDGFITLDHPKRRQYQKTGYKWQLSDRAVATVLRCCLPYLYTKRTQALTAIRFVETQYWSRFANTGQGRLPLPPNLAKRQAELHQQMKQLNHRGPHHDC